MVLAEKRPASDTVILNIIKEKDTYLCMVQWHGFQYCPSIIPTFRTKTITHERKGILQDLALLAEMIVEEKGAHNYIQQLQSNIEDIGKKIYYDLKLDVVFNALFAENTKGKIKNLIICTDDLVIPWQWAFNKEFLCERFNYGKFYIKGLDSIINNDDLGKFFNVSDTLGNCDDNEKDYLNSRIALLLHGSGKKDSSVEQTKELICFTDKNEIKSLRNFFSKNISIPVTTITDHREFYSRISDCSVPEKIKILHFTGKMSGDGIKISNNCQRISARQILTHINENKLTSQPLVFFNTYKSSFKPSVCLEEAKLATSFLELGATCCIFPIFSLNDHLASEFILSFYKNATRLASVGEAIRQTRLEQKIDNTTNNDISRLFFDFYGDPRRPFIKVKSSEERKADWLQEKEKEKKKIQGESKKLRDIFNTGSAKKNDYA